MSVARVHREISSRLCRDFSFVLKYNSKRSALNLHGSAQSNEVILSTRQFLSDVGIFYGLNTRVLRVKVWNWTAARRASTGAWTESNETCLHVPVLNLVLLFLVVS